MKGIKNSSGVVAFLLVALPLWTVGPVQEPNFQPAGYANAAPKVREAAGALECVSSEARDDGLNLTVAFSNVADATIPAVVNVQVTHRREVPNPLLQHRDDPAIRQFFGDPKDLPEKLEQEVRGVGTGMIVDQKGHILTNNHVVEGAAEIDVVLSSGEEYKATVVGTDPKTDLAIIKIPAKESLPVVRFGNSDQVRVAQWVIAIGHPRGLDQTVTQGIISAKHRTGISDPSDFQDFLQTDAPINPGNSGGPLLNLRGEVIGVNSAIATQSGGFEGLAFAIPSNMAIHVANALMAKGKVERGWLGVSIQKLPREKARSVGLSSQEGAWVAEVMKGGPAESAGVKKGDIILMYRGEKIKGDSDLRNRVAQSPIGQKVPVTVLRNGARQELTVKVGNLEELTRKMTELVKTHLGVTVVPVTSKVAGKYGLESPKGVLIQWVDPKGPVGKAQLEEGDIILAVNNTPVLSVDMFLGLVESLPHEKTLLAALDHRTGQTGYVQVEIPEMNGWK